MTSQSLSSPASLTFVAKISPDNFWLMSDGAWKGPTEYTPTLADVKLNCRLVAPELPPFAADFGNVLENMKWLMANSQTEGNKKKGVFDAGEKPIATIRVRHVLFEKRGDDSDDSEDDFKIKDWPATSDVAQKALRQMTSTHRVLLYRHTTPTGTLFPGRISIAPKKDTTDTGSDIYAADIEGFRVLVPAPKFPNPSTPSRKRKIMATDPGPSSPSKKRHTH
ncbi:hypothetical protein C8J57DRAFT_1523579 [Mycena rebaudengoi]|nr:hypothetical protein C8J57DRAFT_1523579 [Mycena rebaudengoi]